MQITQEKIIMKRFHKIKERCYNPNSKSYPRYGGRGIKVCDEWLDNPRLFVEWSLEHGFKKDLAIDRIDNDGNYCPENCRYVTPKENNQNRSSTRFFTYNGKTQSLARWCEELNLVYGTIQYRLIRGWSFERAITEPTIRRNRQELIGKRFGRLTVMSYAGDEYIGSDNNSRYVCKCDCGNTTIVGSNKLKSGHTKSCGCLQREAIRITQKKSPGYIQHIQKEQKEL